MPEQDLSPAFAALRAHLETSARQPAFADIRAARARRSRRAAVTGVAVLTLLSLAAVAVGIGWLRPSPPPVINPAPTPPPSPTAAARPTPSTAPTPSASSTAAAPQPATVVVLTARSGGALYAIGQRCLVACDSVEPGYEYAVRRTTDLGVHWTQIAALSGPSPVLDPIRLLDGGQGVLWFVAGDSVRGSSTGGRTWQRWTVPSIEDISVTDGAAWFVAGGQTMVASGGGKPTRTAAQPKGTGVAAVVAVTGDRAYAQGPMGDAAWYLTTDRGAHWAKVADPCAGTPWPRSPFTTLAVARDGSLWAVCSAGGGLGNQPKTIAVSADQGQTWQRRRPDLETQGYGTDVYGMSSTVAWRTGGRADIYRTEDGAHWTDVVPGVGGPGGPSAFAAVDADTAAYVGMSETGGMVLKVTTDGGRTWVDRPFSP